MKNRGMSRSHLFLIELIVVILFFSFAGVITVQVFSKAFQLAEGTTALNGATIVVQTAAETDRTRSLEEFIPSQNIVYYNKGWEVTNPSNAAYTMTTDATLEERWAGSMAIHHYTVTSGDKIIYQLLTKKYYSGNAALEASPSEEN